MPPSYFASPAPHPQRATGRASVSNDGRTRSQRIGPGFTERGKAWSNTLGSLLLGVPLCWIILTRGMWSKSNLINAPLLSFEVSQSGYGMYVKYLMAGFLVVYAVSMLLQFLSYFLRSAAVLLRDPGPPPATSDGTR